MRPLQGYFDNSLFLGSWLEMAGDSARHRNLPPGSCLATAELGSGGPPCNARKSKVYAAFFLLQKQDA